MRKLIVLSFISLDGVMQAPGGPEEDTSGGFKFGGWTVPYWDDFSGEVMNKQMNHPFDLLLGLKTYQIWENYWPKNKEGVIGEAFEKATKYVAAFEKPALSWENSVWLEGDVVEAVKKLKVEDGPELQVHGSGNFIQTLLKNDLVDELWLKTFPVLLGTGKKLFADGVIPAAFTLEESSVSPKGVIFANYKRAGEVKVGSFV